MTLLTRREGIAALAAALLAPSPARGHDLAAELATIHAESADHAACGTSAPQ